MKSMHAVLSSSADELHNFDSGSASGTAEPIRVKALGERDRRRLLTHFLALGDEDRMQRFGSLYTDDAITRYVQRIDLDRDEVFGVFDDLQLIGVGHLAFTARDATPQSRQITVKACVGKLGISVLPEARGQGVGAKLLERAAMHCRNQDVDILLIPCLASNQAMLRMANKAGMQVKQIDGETKAYLSLQPANAQNMLEKLSGDQLAQPACHANANPACLTAQRLPC